MTSDPTGRFAGRRIYLTGAASGIGLATARLLAGEGATLALVDVNEAGLRAAAKETGGHPFVVELRDGEAIDRSVQAAGEALGGLDGVVNCAGVALSAGVDVMDPADWDRVLAINLTAPYRVCRAALPLLKAEKKASIVNVSSGAALVPSNGGASAYAASKGGLISFGKMLAAETAPNIRVNTICPGVVDTPMTAFALRGDPAVATAFLGAYAMKRAAEPVELAEAIAFLLSDQASFITGITLSADGGRSFH